MTSHALALSPATETKWTILSGPMSGVVRLMNSSAFFIGRSPENEFVVVSDPKCSRKHANVQWTENGCEITSLNEANPVQINGKEVPRGVLADGDIVTVGATEIQFNLTSRSSSNDGAHDTQLALADHSAMPVRSRARPQKRGHSKQKSDPKRLVIYFVLGLVVLLIFTGNAKKKKDALVLRTEQQIQADIDAANKLQEAAQNMPGKRFNETVTSSQAQENFVRGFRDYREGQFERSLDSFQACLALNPTHVLCNRYIRLAQRRFNEIVQYDMVLGRKYRDQSQFNPCRAAFRNVMVMVKDANSQIYKEAKANYDACSTLAEGRY
jgi:hypothetical protein